jgi:hypothetical protein
VGRLLSAILATVSALALLAAGLGFYARSEIVSADGFAERASSVLGDREVRELIAEEVVDGLVEQASSDLLVVRPLLESAITALAGTAQFRQLFEFAVRDAHGVLTGARDSSVILDLDRAAALLIDALRSVSPDIADSVPAGLEPHLARLDADDFEIDGAQLLSSVADSASTLLGVGLLAAVVSVAVGTSRRRAMSRVGVAIAAAALSAAVLVAVVGQVVAAQAGGAADDVAADGERVSGAVAVLWERLFGDLRDVSLVVSIVGLAFAAVASGSLTPATLGRHASRARAVLRSPRPAARAARGAAALALGLWVIAHPESALRFGALLLGGALAFVGVAELTAALARERVDDRRSAPGRFPLAGQLATGAACVAVVAGAAVAAVEMLGRPSDAAAVGAPPEGGCNGSRSLCERRLNQVAFPTTHNSFSAADEPGWLFANQRYGIARQLTDGVRGLLLDIHYGVPDGRSGRIRTDLRAGRSSRNRVARQLDPEALRVADRLAGRVGLGDLRGSRSLYLCHSLCELGAEPLAEELATIRDFLRAHPNEVIVLVLESFVDDEQVERAFGEADLLEHAAALRRDAPLPTLGELVEQDRRLVVFTEQGGHGRPWYHDAFAYIQDTPLGAQGPGDFSCDRFRGSDFSPMFAIYHWIDRFPPPPSRNARIGGPYLRDRVRRCAEDRGLVPNLIAVDFYHRSGVVEAARELNARPPLP